MLDVVTNDIIELLKTKYENVKIGTLSDLIYFDNKDDCYCIRLQELKYTP